MVNIMRVRAASSGWTGGPGLNTFYFVAGPGASPSTPTETEAALGRTRVHAAMDAAKGIFPASWRCQVSGVVDIIDATTGALVDSLVNTAPASISGTSGSGYLPPSTCILGQLRTSTFVTGRKLQGRTFLGPVSATIDADGSPNGAAVDVGNAWATALLDAGLTAVPILVVWRRPRLADATRKTVSARSARDGAYAPVTSISVPDKYAVLRSRRD